MSPPEQITVSYFDGRGRGESIRLLLSHVGASFVDDRIKTADREDGFNWIEVQATDAFKKLKKETPLGQWPVLTIDGKKLAQSATILRFLGHKYDIAGTTPFEDAIVDMLGDAIQDGYNILDLDYSTVATFKQYFKDVTTPYLHNIIGPMFEKILVENSKSGYLVGDKLTWVDIHAGEFFNKYLLHGGEHALDNFPTIKAHNERMHSLPNIKAWVDKRQPSQY